MVALIRRLWLRPVRRRGRGSGAAGRTCLRVLPALAGIAAAVLLLDGVDRVIISVADDGLGMWPEKLEALREALKGTGTARVGIGLGNIYQRINTMYKGGGLRLYSREGSGTVVQMTIPQDAEMNPAQQ